MAPSKAGTVRLLVGFDGSDHACEAAHFARLLADQMGAELEAAYIVAEHPPRNPDAPTGGPVPFGGGRETVPLRLISARSPAAGLYELVDSERPALLVVGATHQRGAGKLLHGSVPGRLLAGLPCPLMVVPAGYAAPGRIRVIEVGFDGSAESRAALALARDLAQRAETTLRVIAVEAPPATEAPIDRPVARPHLEEQLHDAVAQLPSGLRALPVFARGEAAAQLLDRADEGVDLLVIGSRTYGPLRSVLLGSVSTMVVERAPCPVIVTPRPAAIS